MSALVSGHVYDSSGRVLAHTTFVVLNTNRQPIGKQFTTDASGTYGVYLVPGDYIVQDKGDPKQEGRIKSYPQPVYQDIHLQSK